MRDLRIEYSGSRGSWTPGANTMRVRVCNLGCSVQPYKHSKYVTYGVTCLSEDGVLVLTGSHIQALDVPLPWLRSLQLTAVQLYVLDCYLVCCSWPPHRSP
jgi:hypothetical protein